LWAPIDLRPGGGEREVEDDPQRRREDKAVAMGWWGPHAGSYVGGFSR
jgi:hypothetical protein